MHGLPFKRVVVSLLFLGVLVEINTAYKRAVGIPVEAMGGVTVIKIPSAFRDSITEVPIVREFDRMTVTSGMTITSW